MAYTKSEQILDSLKNGTTTVASCRSVVCRLRKSDSVEDFGKIMLYLEAIERYNYFGQT